MLISYGCRAEVAQHLVDSLGDVDGSLLPVTLAPQVLDHVVVHDRHDEPYAVVFGTPGLLLGVVHEELGILPVDGILGGLRRLALVRLRRGRVAAQEVPGELGPGAAYKGPCQPFLELTGVLEREELEDEALMLR